MYVLCPLSSGHNTMRDDLSDDTKICDIKPYFCIIKITEKKVKPTDDIVDNITRLIGKQFKDSTNPEVRDFRSKMALLGNQISYKRQKMTWAEKLLYQFPPRVANSPDMPETVKGRLRNDHFVLVVKFENDETSFTFNVRYDKLPQELLDLVLAKKALTMNKRHDRASDYVLKIAGRDEYLFGYYPLVQFLYIQVIILINLKFFI